MSEYSLLQIIRHGDDGTIAELALDRPGALNAISTEFAQQITAATAELSADPSVAVVVLTSTAARAFCVGADLKERNSFTDEQMLQQRTITTGAYGGVLNLPVPAIAAVEGFALGGGFELALSCDLIVASDTAVVGLPEVSVGVIPGGGGTQLLSRRVGSAKAARAIFTAGRYDAAAALLHGFVDEVAPAGDAREQALGLAAAIAKNSPVGLRNAKAALRQGYDLPLAQGLEIEGQGWQRTVLSADRAEGITAFVEKRPPRWPGLKPAGTYDDEHDSGTAG